MREIKFRAWVKTDDDYFEDCGIRWSMNTSNSMEETISLLNWNDSDSKGVLLMQYTGLLDKNGVEIYEGDILYCKNDESSGVVEFDNGCFVTEAYGYGQTIVGYRLDLIEVIGNIYENKELLETT